MWSNSQISQVFPGLLRTVTEGSPHLSLPFFPLVGQLDSFFPCPAASYLTTPNSTGAGCGLVCFRVSPLCFSWGLLGSPADCCISRCPGCLRQMGSGGRVWLGDPDTSKHTITARRALAMLCRAAEKRSGYHNPAGGRNSAGS